jgi:hypothetical protein
MTRYLISIYQPEGEPPAPDFLEAVGRELHALNEEIKGAGGWVFTGGLCPPATATVVRVQDEEVLVTDGPYAEGKEHIGGFWVVQAPDLDTALGWARKAARATTLPIEVRPFQDRPDY